jgi:hypothetical protein
MLHMHLMSNRGKTQTVHMGIDDRTLSGLTGRQQCGRVAGEEGALAEPEDRSERTPAIPLHPHNVPYGRLNTNGRQFWRLSLNTWLKETSLEIEPQTASFHGF